MIVIFAGTVVSAEPYNVRLILIFDNCCHFPESSCAVLDIFMNLKVDKGPPGEVVNEDQIVESTR